MSDLEQKKNKRKVWLISIAVYAVIALLAYLIVNSDSVSTWFQKFGQIVSPVLTGLAIAYLCNPILRLFDLHIFKWIRNPKVRRVCSLIGTYLLIVLLILFICLLLFPELFSSIEKLQAQYEQYSTKAFELINGLIDKIMSQNGTEYVNEQVVREFLQKLFFDSENLVQSVIALITNYGTKFLSGISNILIGLIISVYVLYSKEKRLAQCKKAVSALLNEKHELMLDRTVRLIDNSFGGFIEGKLLDSLIIGILTYIVLLIFNIPYAVLVAVIVGITNIIPIFGPFIGAIPSVFIIFITDPPKALVFLILIVIIQQIDGNIIGPKILGNNIGVSAFCVTISIVIMGKLFGVMGMIMGVPLFAVIVVLVTDFLDNRLSKKGLPTETAEYLPEDNGMLAKKEKVKFSQKISNLFGKKKDK